TPSAPDARTSSGGARSGRATTRAAGRSESRADRRGGSPACTGDRGRSDRGGALRQARWVASLDYFVRPRQHRRRAGQAEGLRGLAVDDSSMPGLLGFFVPLQYLRRLQFLSRSPESLAVRSSHPILRELIGRRAPRADDRAFAGIAVDPRPNVQDETV